jgi:hypothetical protein
MVVLLTVRSPWRHPENSGAPSPAARVEPTGPRRSSEEAELLLAGGEGLSLGVDLDHVEPDGLGEGSALADGHDVTLLDTGEGGGAVGGEILVSLLEPVVLLDVVEVVSSDDDGPSHLG